MASPPSPLPGWLPWALGAGAMGLVAVGVAKASTKPDDDPLAGVSPARRLFLEHVETYQGTLYQWGGGRSPGSDYGVDCSGLIIAALRDANLPLPPCPLATSDGWWQCLPRIPDPLPGDLALYGTPGRAVHVEVVKRFDGTDADTVGAEGGDRDVLTPAIAEQRNARVRDASTHARSNFLGFCRNPLDQVTSTTRSSHGVQIDGVQPDLAILQSDEA